MIRLAVLTPSYRPDFELFRELHRSILRHTAADVVHHVVLHPSDIDLFSALASPRLKIHNSMEVLGSKFLSVHSLAQGLRALGLASASKIQAINLTRPWVPLRGWIVQQLVKLAVAARIDADVVLVIDSDAIIVQPMAGDAFVRNGAVRLYKWPDIVGPHMPQHVRWLGVARDLLQLPQSTLKCEPDYIAGFISWDPAIVRRMLHHITAVKQTDWITATAGQLHFSECMLYGTYVDHFGSERERSFIESNTLCRTYYPTRPLEEADAVEFVDSVGQQCLAILIQSASRTSANVRSQIAQQVEQRLNGLAAQEQ